jgi:hypothetical protein
MKADFTTLLAFIVVASSSTVNAQGEAGTWSAAVRGACPVFNPPTCFHPLPDLGRQGFTEVAYPANVTDLTFKQGTNGFVGPGKYTFEFRSFDLCTHKPSPQDVVHVKCPPQPKAFIKFDKPNPDTDYFLGDEIRISTGDAKSKSEADPSFATKAVMTYKIKVLPCLDDATCQATTANHLKTDFTTITAGTNGIAEYKWHSTKDKGAGKRGQYVVLLSVSDGCSTKYIKSCFTVGCNCGPTANAGKTVTMWSNNAAEDATNNNPIVNASNNAGLRDESTQVFTLDGSLSYDFDLYHRTTPEILTYEWSFVAWEPASNLPFATNFEPSCSSREGFNSSKCNLLKPTARDNFQYNPSAFSTIPNTNTWLAPCSTCTAKTAGTGSACCPAGSTNAIWNGQAATQTVYGYQTVISKPKSATNVKTVVEFKRIAKLPQTKPQDVKSTEPPARDSVKSATTSIAVKDYPLWMPRYNNNQNLGIVGAEENFRNFSWAVAPVNPTTTSCQAWLFRTQSSLEQTQKLNTNTVSVDYKREKHLTFCRMEITQQSLSSPIARVLFEHPDSQEFGRYAQWVKDDKTRLEKMTPTPLPRHSFEYCRGIMTFKLTVQDECKIDTQSIDYIDVTVRCNTPPVAIAGCDTTIIYKPALPTQSGFEQVTIDGRASKDIDNTDSLTYYWAFLQYPPAHKTRGTKCAHVPCKQTYCNNNNLVVNPYAVVAEQNRYGDSSLVFFGGAVSDIKTGVTSYDDDCGPTVYPMLYKLDTKTPANCVNQVATANLQPICQYESEATTRGHKGNSAYFTPNAEGTYIVQLAVFDGCSTVIDTVSVVAKCPQITWLPAATTDYTGIQMSESQPACPGAANQNLCAQYTTGQSPSVKLKTATGNTAPNFENTDSNYKQKVTYVWSYTKTGSTDGKCACAAQNPNCCVFSNPTSGTETTFTAGEKGSFRFSLTVSDGCQTIPVKSPPSRVWAVICNSPPTINAIDNGNRGVGAVTQLFRTAAPFEYPAVTLTASGTDVDTADRHSFTWTVTETGANGRAGSAVSSSVSLTYPNQNNQVNKNNQIVIKPSVTQSGPVNNYQIKDGVKALQVQATMSDGCSQTTSASQTVNFECNSAGLSLVATPTNTLIPSVSYSFVNPVGFQPITFNAAASVTPYTFNRKVYRWCAYPFGGTCAAGNLPAAVTATGGNAESMVLPLPATSLGTYVIELTVSDDCSTTPAKTWTVSTICPAVPTANLKVPSGTRIVWNSNARPTAGDFPPITLDASDSTKAAGAETATLSYDLRLTAPSSQPVSTSATAQFTASAAGTYTFSLTVNNGPCRSTPVSVTVQFECLSLTPVLALTGAAEVPHPGPARASALWDGVRFPTICMDGRNLRYGVADTRSAQNQNLNSLRYTWTVKTAPGFYKGSQTTGTALPTCSGLENPSCALATSENKGSMFYKSGDQVEKTPANPSFDSVTPVEIPYTGVRTVSAPSTNSRTGEITTNETEATTGVLLKMTVEDSTKTTVTTYAVEERRQTTLTTTTTTTLFNHHYNLPLTCFVPDKVGAYTIELRVDDGCVNKAMNAEISAACPTPPVPAFTVPEGNTVRMSGIQFKRVTLDARAITPSDSKNTLTYQWTLEDVDQPARKCTDSKLCGSKIKITNDRGSIASFVPDIKGAYKIKLTVSDGCNTPRSTEQTITVDCDASSIDVQRSTVQSGTPTTMKTPTTGQDAEIWWRTSINPQDNYEGYQFLLRGSSGTTCSVKRRQWFLINRQCADPYKTAAPTVAATTQAQCKQDYTCRWALHKIPCMKKAGDYRGEAFGWIKDADSRDPAKNTVRNGKDDLPLTINGATKRELVPCEVGAEVPNARCLLENLPSRSTQCVTSFQCRAPGTYQLSLTVGDGCSETRKFMCVTCRCQTRLAVDAGVGQAALYSCNQNGVNEFGSIKLKGQVTPLEARTGLELEKCEREPTPVKPKAAPDVTCCPKAPECPTCPHCPSCPDKCTPVPSCPTTSGRGSAKTRPSPAARNQRRRAFHAAEEKDSSKTDKFSFAHVMGVTIPLSSVMVLTLLGNVILHRKIKCSEAEMQ